MTKMRWRNRRHGWSGTTRDTRALEAAADRILRLASEPKPSAKAPPRARHKPRTSLERDEVWITIGEDCPWNPRPGTRLVLHFRNRREADAAREAGFKLS